MLLFFSKNNGPDEKKNSQNNLDFYLLSRHKTVAEPRKNDIVFCVTSVENLISDMQGMIVDDTSP